MKLVGPRILEESDFHKKYLDLLSHLSKPSNLSFDQFCMQLKKLSSSVWVMEDETKCTIIASISLLIEEKLIRNRGKVGHIEDLVVHPDYQKNCLGKKLISHVVDFSMKMECYKVILNCHPNLTKFYESCGFKKTQEQMSMYF